VKSHVKLALQDITEGVRQFRLGAFLAWEDIRRRYVRTLFGPWWIVLSLGIWFAVMGFVMSNVLDKPLDDYLPYLVSGLLVWTLISASVTDGSNVLVGAAPLIRTFPIPIFTHYIRFILRNVIVFAHNIVILAVIMFLYPQPVEGLWLALPGLMLNLMILMNAGLILSLANLRYRDTHLAVASTMQAMPFITPIFWNRDMLQEHLWVADVNPLYHMIEIVRAPLLGHQAAGLSWTIAIALACGTFVMAYGLFIRFRHRIIFWL
jgi:ABC-type polysaccharide/polyol phosphate export permease